MYPSILAVTTGQFIRFQSSCCSDDKPRLNFAPENITCGAIYEIKAIVNRKLETPLFALNLEFQVKNIEKSLHSVLKCKCCICTLILPEVNLMKAATKVTIIYLIVGYLWILFSDQFLLFLLDDTRISSYAVYQTYKGFAFVSLTGLMLYLLLNHYQGIEEKNLKMLETLNRDLDRKAINLNQANRNLEQFTYVISHDLQEPLSVLRITLKQLNRIYGHLLDEKGIRFLAGAEESAVQMKQLINKMYNYYEVSTHVSEDVVKVDLNKMMEDVRIWNSRLLQNKNGTLKWMQLPELMVSPRLIFRLFEILVRNALRYAADTLNPKVEISFEVQEKYLLFKVTDNGPGIPADIQKNLFILFSPDAHGNLTGQSSGLAIVHKIVTSLNGQISFTSSPDSGTTFCIYLPKTMLAARD